MKKIKILFLLLLVTILVVNCGSSTKNISNQTNRIKAYSVAQLMNNPVYEKTIHVYGTIEELGIRNSKSFKLSSDGQSIQSVWYGMMVHDDRQQEPNVDISNFRNGDVVVITGKLKRKGRYVLKDSFWLSAIKKKQ